MLEVNSETLAKYYRRSLEKKQYSRLLAIPGNIAQASEFSDIQDLLGDQIKSVGDAVMTNGNIVKGCEIVIDKARKKATITPGKIYLDGFVRDLLVEQTVDINATGTEHICAWVEEEIITCEDDTDLFDPSILSAYQQAGCDAIHYKVVIGSSYIDNNNVEQGTGAGKPILYTLVDGALPTSQVASNQYEPIVEIMARRTYDESGNYRIRGLRIVDRKANDTNNIFLTLTSGKAYIRGYETVIPFDTKFAVRKASDTETSSFTTKVNAREYKLSTTPVAKITKATFNFTFETTTANRKIEVTDDIDEGSVRVIYQGVDKTSDLNSIGAISIDGHSFELADNTNVNRIIPAGDTYTLRCSFRIENLATKDYTFNSSGTFRYTGSLTVDNTRDAVIEYEYYLSRRDLIAIDSKGKIWVTEGQPNIQKLCSVPKVDDPDTLPLGVVTVVAGSNTPIIIDQSIDVTDMFTLQKMLRRLQELEYNSAVGDLDREAIEGEDATELIGVFTDGFIGWTKMDKGKSDIDCAINSEGQFLSVSYDLGEMGLSTTTKPNYCGVHSLPFDNVLTNMQMLASESQKVNPYQAFDPLVPIKLTCYKYSQNIKSYNGTITYNQTQTTLLPWKNQLSCTDTQKNEVTVRENVKTVSTNWVVYDRTHWYSQGGKNSILNYFGVDNINKLASYGSAVSNQTFGGQTWALDYDVSTSVKGNAVTQAYMKSKIIYVYAVGFVAYSDKIYATFGGDRVHLDRANDPGGTYTSGCTRGTDVAGYRTLRADANGTILGSFTIPANTPCGKYDIKIFVEGNSQQGIIAKNGVAVYDGQYTTQRDTTTITPIHKTLGVTIYNTDPLAQSFSFTEEKFLTGVDLYFSVCNDSNPVQVQIRSMENGYPGTDILGEQTLTRNQIRVSGDASAVTTVTFDNPIRLSANTQYCIVILTDSPNTAVWTATLGQRKWGYNDSNDPNKQQFITAQPYQAGVLFTSSNNLTWTAHQGSDLKFGIRTARFNISQPKIITYDAITSTQADITNFALEVDYILPSGCSIIWEYHTDAMSSSKWSPLEPFEEISLDRAINTLQFRATIRSTNPLVSPLLSDENAWVTFICNHINAKYYSRSANLGSYNHLKVQVDLSTSSKHTHKVSLSTNNSQTFTELSLANATEVTPLGNGYNRYLWDMNKDGDNASVKIEMTTTDPADIPKAQKLIIIGSEL